MSWGRVLRRRSPIASEHSSDSPLVADLPPLAVQNLSKRYNGGTWANQNIDLTGHPREILGIVGPNGAGKTTLVRQITTELLPTLGSVDVLGYDVVREPTKVKSLLGIVPQEAALIDFLSVYRQLRIFSKLRGIRPRDAGAIAEQLIEELELSEYRDMPADKLSGGLRRRVMVGIAAIAQPPIMVLDEPTTGLDPQSRRNLWSLLRRYREQGSFVLLTTHSMEEAEALCDRVGIIQNGKLLALDTVANLKSNHGFQYKITYFPDSSTSGGVTLYGSNSQDLVSKVMAMGISQYSVGQTNLEDVYLTLTGTAATAIGSSGDSALE